MEQKLIGFDEDCEHVLCERCSTPERICCEKFRQECDYYDCSYDCPVCFGCGFWWWCSCDENGKHARPTANASAREE